MKQYAGKISKWLLPLIFIGYFSCVSLFQHAHIVNGVIIVHSHRTADKANEPTHQHQSAKESQLYHFLSHFNIEDGAIASLYIEQISPLLIGDVVCSWNNPILPSTPWCSSALRAPPVM